MRYAIKLAGLAAAGALAIAGCGGPAAVTHTAAATPTAARPTPTFEFTDVESLVAAMAVHGALCSAVSFVNGEVPGSINPYVDCSGVSEGDTSVSMFTSHASALAYARAEINTGQGLGQPTAEVIGPNWVVNTVPAFARKVVHAVGGQVISWVPAAPTPATTPTSPAESEPPPQTVTYVVTGTPGAADITYGPAGSESSGTDPMDVTAPLGSPAYYALTAQLQGGGTVTVTIDINGQEVSTGTATGGYNIATAEVVQNPVTGVWEDANTG